MTLAAGTRVTTNVELSRPLGAGGMGSVWVARHQGLDADVAVKFVSAELSDGDGAASSRFKREAALSAKIKSPHVVKTFDYGVTDDGTAYIVMELLEGESLGDRLAREGRLVPRDVALVVSQTAQVLEEAHALGVVHRDIKPDNIFLIDAGYELFVKVLDFGIAKQTTKLGVASVTDTGAIIGTPEYMSPEQLLTPKSADWRADMWAVAVLAYRALTGTVPFAGETLPSLSLAICNATFEPPSRLVEGLPPGVDDWFTHALEPKPGDRFESVAEMAHTLTDLLRTSVAETVSIAHSDTHCRPGQNGEPGTLASPMSEAAPARLPTPEIAIEIAEDDPLASPRPKTLGDAMGLLDDARSESSRRRGPVVIELERPRSTASPGIIERAVPSTMRFDENAEKRYTQLKVAGLLLAGVLAVAAADFILRGPGEVPKPELASSALASSARSAPPSDALWTDDTAVVAPAPPLPVVAPKPRATARASASATASASAPAVAVVPPPRPRQPPKSAPTASVSVDPCDSPYIVQRDGSLKVKPACVNR